MKSVGGKAAAEQAEIHAPKFGSDLAGGSWEVIETFITQLWVPHVDVYVYEYVPADSDGQKQQDDADSSKKDRQADGASDDMGDLFDL